MADCPTCGAALRPNNIDVDLSRNLLLYRGKSVALRPRVAEVAYVLVRHFHQVVEHEKLRASVFGIDNSDRDERRAIVAFIAILRAKVQPLGLEIVPYYRRGYELRAATRKAFRPSDRYVKWSPEIIERLRSMCAVGLPRDQIADKLGWTVPQVRCLHDYLKTRGIKVFPLVPRSSKRNSLKQ